MRKWAGWLISVPSLMDETGEFVHTMPYRAGAYNERTPLMLGIRKDGIDL